MEQTSIYGGDDEGLEVASVGQIESRLEGIVGKVLTIACEGEERKLAELASLGVGERWQVRGATVGGVCAVGEYLKEFEMRSRFGRGGEGLDGGRVEELGEEEGVWC